MKCNIIVAEAIQSLFIGELTIWIGRPLVVPSLIMPCVMKYENSCEVVAHESF